MIGLECRRIRSNQFNNVLFNAQDRVNCNKITKGKENCKLVLSWFGHFPCDMSLPGTASIKFGAIVGEQWSKGSC